MNPLDFTRTASCDLIEAPAAAIKCMPVATSNVLIHGDNIAAMQQLIAQNGL